MFNKELFLTHIENAPIPQQLGEPLVEMKQKSDIDTIADIMGTSNVQRPLQEQFQVNMFGTNTPKSSPKSESMRQERDRRFQQSQNKIRKVYDTLALGDQTDKGFSPETKRAVEKKITGQEPHEVTARANYAASMEPVRKMTMVDGIPTLDPSTASSSTVQRKLSGVVSDTTGSNPITPSPRPVRATRAQINAAKQKADRTIKSPGYKSQLTRADRDRIIGKVARETGVDSGTLSTNVSMRQSGVKGSGEGGSYTPQDRLNFTQVQVGKERREERKSLGLKPKADDYRLPGGGYDYDAIRSDQEESGEIPRSRRRGPSRFDGVKVARGFKGIDPSDSEAMMQRAREIMQKIENEDKA